MKHCLVVDDSRVIRTVARRILEDLHYSVEEAEDGMAGLRAVREKMPDLIFLDWNLPSMKGVDFVKSVRGQQEGGHPVILFCTTENDPGEIASAMAAGANEYVMKPFDGAAVRAKLADIGVTVLSAPMAPDDFAFLARLLRRRCGLSLTHDKMALRRTPPGAGDAPLRLQGHGRR